MPVERILTPRPLDRPVIERVEDAKVFIKAIVKFFTDTNQIYKFFIFGYITLMMLFVFVVDSKTYDFKKMGNEVYGAVALVEAFLAASCVLAILGLVKTRTIYLVPLLLLQMGISLYGFVFYLCPYVANQQITAMSELEKVAQIDTFAQVIVISKSLLMIVLRTCPLFVQFLFTTLTMRVVICVAIIERSSIPPKLPLFEPRSNSPNVICNSHIWSSIHRKVSSKRREANIEQAQRLPKREFICEMSAKFRNSTFPTSLLQSENSLDL